MAEKEIDSVELPAPAGWKKVGFRSLLDQQFGTRDASDSRQDNIQKNLASVYQVGGVEDSRNSLSGMQDNKGDLLYFLDSRRNFPKTRDLGERGFGKRRLELRRFGKGN
ncbi:hypothetical protein M5K25_023355 [Dendrobium thyrsiflorum]|uniref:Uncharacterized protein n=1 Tax=Dendrobium thyrsiflorum TaxID=117978 RepID=A0ABD0U851_DENTH